MYGCFACMFNCVLTCVSGAHRGQKRTFDFPGTRVTDSCESICGFWDSNTSLVEDQPVLLMPELKYI